MTVSLNQVQTGQWSISIKDITTGQSYIQNVDYAPSLKSADWIEEMPITNHGRLNLDNFGSVQFTNCLVTVNGAPENLTQAGASPMTMINLSGQATATPSAITSDNASFTVTRSDASSSIPAIALSGRSGFMIRRGYATGRSAWRGLAYGRGSGSWRIFNGFDRYNN